MAFELDAENIEISKHARKKFKLLSRMLFVKSFSFDDDIDSEIRDLLSMAQKDKANSKDRDRIHRHDERMYTISVYYVSVGWRFVVDVLRNQIITIERINSRENVG